MDRFAHKYFVDGMTVYQENVKRPIDSYSPLINEKEVDAELQTPSDMSQEFNGGNDSDIQASGSLRAGSSTSESSTRIEIRDSCHEGSSNFTTSTLHKCKKEVLRPYWNLLIFIGWRGFNRESIFAQGFRWRFLNGFYTCVVMFLLLYTYSYEVLACEWRLDVTVDTLPIVRKIPATEIIAPMPAPSSNTTNMSTLFRIGRKDAVDSTAPAPCDIFNRRRRIIHKDVVVQDDDSNPACDHIVTSYLIPGLLHFIAYVLGFYYFRVQENEQLDALMEKVFLQATTLQARNASQQDMIKKQRLLQAHVTSSRTACSWVPILQVGGMRKVRVNCFPKAIATWHGRESNSRPPGLESDALTTQPRCPL
ncbi:nucleolar protein 10 [Elysia marginata]|uniref:Nucleolar protein 10 n=1 Tax=Elysia marginata TaxID=1093978 RepID=A0AAV4FZX9_9GAST|nr:nucleolar protein 10 [Elysia marginata]